MHCLLCQQELVNELTLITLLTGYQTVDEQFCSSCRHAFQPIRKSVCYGCGRMMKTASYCEDCQRWQDLGQVMIQNRALYLYNDQMKDYMARYKFIGDYRLRILFKAEMQKNIRQQMKADNIDSLIPIPISKWRYQERGFNQVMAFIPKTVSIQQPLLVSKAHKVDQSSKKRAERLQTKQPFELKLGMAGAIKKKRILLVDDVYTTGRTVYHAANLLLSAGASAVFSQTLAR